MVVVLLQSRLLESTDARDSSAGKYLCVSIAEHAIISINQTRNSAL